MFRRRRFNSKKKMTPLAKPGQGGNGLAGVPSQCYYPGCESARCIKCWNTHVALRKAFRNRAECASRLGRGMIDRIDMY